MLKNFKISAIKKSEIPEMCKIHKESWIATYGQPEYDLTEQDILTKDFDSPAKINKWKKSLENDSYKIWVAKADNKIVGFCGARRGDEENDFSIIYILRSHQHLGIGKAFAQEVFKWLKEDRPITVEVAVKNAQAINFYKKLGFTEIGLIDPTILVNGKRIEIIKMIKH